MHLQRASLRALVVATVAAGLLVSCKRPVAPRVTARSTEFVHTGTNDLAVRVHLVGNNPNEYAIYVHDVSARVEVAKREAAKIQTDDKVALPPAKDVPFSVDIIVPRPMVAELRKVASTEKEIPYRVTGTVDAGTEKMHGPVPFARDGTITRESLLAHLR
jgi:LEA14-like dessication related protein